MSWASQEDVLKHHRMLMPKEAAVRQVLLAFALGVCSLVIIPILPIAAALLNWALGSFTLYFLICIVRPIDKETLDLSQKEQTPTPDLDTKTTSKEKETGGNKISSYKGPNSIANWFFHSSLSQSLARYIFGALLISLITFTIFKLSIYWTARDALIINTLSFFLIILYCLIYIVRPIDKKKVDLSQKEQTLTPDSDTKKTSVEKETGWNKISLYKGPNSIANWFFHSSLSQSLARYIIGALLMSLITFTIFKLPIYWIALDTLIINTLSFFLIIAAYLLRIENMEIDEYPTKKIEKLQLWFYRHFSYARGFYFIGMVGKKILGLTRMQRFMHTLIGAPTGEGKSSSLIIPALMFDADGKGSAVVPDAKSPELFSWVAGRWLSRGKKVFLFDPWDSQTVGMNFLPSADDQDLLTIVEVLMREREEVIGKEDAFFKSRTKYLLFAIFKLVQSFGREYCNFSTVYHVLQSVETLNNVVESSHEDIQCMFTDFKDLNRETKVNAVTSIREKLDIFMDADVRKAFSKEEFNLSMLFKENESCLLVIGAPVDKKEPGTKIASMIVNLIINLAFQERRIYKQEMRKGKRHMVPNDLYLYLDELRNLRITALADLVSIARETRTHVIGSVTDLQFLKYYKEDFGGLLGNFRTRLYMRGLDYDSAKYVSDSLGKDNVVTYRYMRGIMASQEQRPLLDPDKVMNIPEDKMIIFSPKTRPFIGDMVRIYNSPWLKKMQLPAPEDMRKLYMDWGIATAPLQDPVLPMVEGDMDLAKMKSGKVPPVNKKYTVEQYHRDTNAVYRRAEDDKPQEVDSASATVEDDANLAAANDLSAPY